jgi:hypothetical protein
LLTAALRNFLKLAIFSTFAGLASQACAWRGVTTMVVAELKTKVEKYETKASRCEQQAREATDKAEQSFYEVLAGYYGSLATDFRKILEKRVVA